MTAAGGTILDRLADHARERVEEAKRRMLPAEIRQEALDKAASLGLHPYASLEELLRPEQGEVMEIPLTFPYRENSRALGLADMAKAIQTGRQHRANGELTFHVLEVMEAFAASGASHQPVEIHSRPRLTPPMPPMGKPGVLD